MKAKVALIFCFMIVVLVLGAVYQGQVDGLGGTGVAEGVSPGCSVAVGRATVAVAARTVAVGGTGALVAVGLRPEPEDVPESAGLGVLVAFAGAATGDEPPPFTGALVGWPGAGVGVLAGVMLGTTGGRMIVGSTSSCATLPNGADSAAI